MSAPPDPPGWSLAADVVRALVLYALAEVQAGHASTLHVTLDGADFSIADDGRGHAVDRQVDGQPYLRLVYTHLDYPFGGATAPAVQLQGIGLSLINRLCTRLAVVVRKAGATHRVEFREGTLVAQGAVEGVNDGSGNTIVGTLRPDLAPTPGAIEPLQRWLEDLLATTPSLRLFLNGHELGARGHGGRA